MALLTEEYRARAVKIAERIRKSLDDEFNILKEIMDLRFRLLTDTRELNESEIRLILVYIDLVVGIYHDRMHIECADIIPELSNSGFLEKKIGH